MLHAWASSWPAAYTLPQLAWLVCCAPDDISVECLVGYNVKGIRLLLSPLLRLLPDLHH
jgi:hypothetical protein